MQKINIEEECLYKKSILIVSKTKIIKRKWINTSFRNQLLVINLVETIAGLEKLGHKSRIVSIANALRAV
jgi:hypothetical protein